MKSLFRILSRVLALAGVGVIALISIAWVGGENLGNPAGAVWSKLHSPSLLYFQTVVQRHLGLVDFWDNYIVAMLEWPAWVVMSIEGALLLILAVLFAVLGHESPKSGNAFQNTTES